MSALLSAESLGVAVGGRTILSGIDLTVDRGESLGLIGRNGIGKTSLLRTLCGLLPPAGGRALLGGRAATAAAARRGLFFLPDGFRPPAALTGHDTLRHLAALQAGRPDPARITAAAAALRYDPAWLALPAGRWSKGMGQSFGLLAALSSGCPLLLLDEPLDGLDPPARAAARAALAAHVAAGGAVILSSHTLADLDSLCDRIAVLAGGGLVALAPPAALPGRAPGESLESAALRLIDAATPPAPNGP